MKNMLIAIEGVDGSGKATQTKLCLENLVKLGYKVDSISFPSYGEWSSIFVEKFLNGEFGEMNQIDPFLASTFYTLDRFGQKDMLEHKLKKNDFVISDRYGISNFLHRGTGYLEKNDMDGLHKFFDWIYDLEYNRAGLPKPDKIIFLSLDIKNVESLLHKKSKEGRSYLKGSTLDIAEKDFMHQTLSLRVGKEILPEYFPNYTIIECDDPRGGIFPPQDINKKILDEILK